MSDHFSQFSISHFYMKNEFHLTKVPRLCLFVWKQGYMWPRPGVSDRAFSDTFLEVEKIDAAFFDSQEEQKGLSFSHTKA